MATQYTIQGVKVSFPHKPYPSQFCMMERIIKGLERHQNCLLESPTGSGKSLALLCSALAWLDTEKAKAEAAASAELKEKNSDCCCCQSKSNSASDGDAQKPGVNQQPAATAPGQANGGTAAEGAATPGKSHNPHTIFIDDIEDLDSDFKTSTKKFRTPGQAAKPQQQQQPTDVNRDEEVTCMEELKIFSNNNNNSPTECSCSCQSDEQKKPKIRVPRIYFGTRTHKQIAQIARELGKTGYRQSRMTILASRQHTCIDPEVSRMPNKNEECRNKLDNIGCRYKDRVPTISHARLEDFGLDFAWDLEDFIGFCNTCKACPYFGTRSLRETADLVLCPYNYLIDPKIRSSMEINLKGEIVILDEGHNIEDAAREAASLTVTLKQIGEAMDDLGNMIQGNVKPTEHIALKKMVSGLYDLIQGQTDNMAGGGAQYENFEATSKIWSGMDMVAQLNHAGAGVDQFAYLKKCLSAISESDKKEEEAVNK